ncbi:sulfite reductase (NADPH) flavoprotein alpha-component [Draconibacterium orientale]|uniref:FAD-binding oxidoreductase n=1 Tax=Draconibacterium orientale TaxID=1168034 RepID=X5DIR6_9BACT|nr:PepSY domain-containing protein [Draconibacterium orientale]AHW60402.1 FAD-binding oxidoreductase [Draconibacterium orientale]SET80519.1 sulfite reductase (NADPH) flavoprotein alpha-component [Draconibacterium orientale]
MVFSIWRISHLLLAVVASLFLLVASVTGVILAVEPITNKIRPYNIEQADELTLAETLTNLNARYDEILSISRDRNGFVSVQAIIDGENEQFYVNPFNGEKLGPAIEKAPIFQFSTSLHRSLFLKAPGRFLIGLAAFLLFLIAVSGIVLIAKRQGGMRYFFAPVVRENFSQFNHVVYARMTLLPIIVLSLSGSYLSLLRFNLIPGEQIIHEVDYETLTDEPKLPLHTFEFLNTTTLGDLRKVEYPFSDFVEDYYTISLKDREVLLNQFNGQIITEKKFPWVSVASSWATVIHTGEGSIVWSVILAAGSLAILFLMLTGFVIYFKRPRIQIKNNYSRNDCSHIVLVGTEGATTLQFAHEFHRQLLKAGIKSYLGLMNDYGPFRNMKQLIIFTATYGQGEPPASASRFRELATKYHQKQPFAFSVVGFGSTAYPNYCRFAYEVFDLLKNLPNANSLGEVHTVNSHSFEALSRWVTHWAEAMQLTLQLEKPKLKLSKNPVSDFEVIDRVENEKENTFLLTLKNTKGAKVVSGDLLSVIPEDDPRERLYSVGNLGNNTLAISVKKYPNGICSTMLSQLEKGEVLSAEVVRNLNFYLPKNTKEVVLIATGTGMGPFLGMIASNTGRQKLHLYWGGRTLDSLLPYRMYINEALRDKRIHNFSPAYSRMQTQKVYVQHLIKKDGAKIAGILKKGGCVMICGSIAMQHDVVKELQTICSTYLQKDLSHFQNRKQVKMDCY